MAGGWRFSLLSFVFIVLWSYVTVLRTAWAILRHPFKALKKTPRDGELGHHATQILESL